MTWLARMAVTLAGRSCFRTKVVASCCALSPACTRISSVRPALIFTLTAAKKEGEGEEEVSGKGDGR